MKKLLALVLFACSVVACAVPDLPSSYRVIVSNDFTDQEASLIQSGMQLWSVFPKGPTFTFQRQDEDSLPRNTDVDWDVMVVHKEDLETVRQIAQDPKALGYTRVFGQVEAKEDDAWDPVPSLIGSSIYLSPYDGGYSFTDTSYMQMSAHEAGHAMSLRHTAEGTVMCATLHCASHTPTCADYQYYCKQRGEDCPCQDAVILKDVIPETEEVHL